MTKPFLKREDGLYDWQDLRDVETLEDLHRVSYGRLMHRLVNGPYGLDEELALIRVVPDFGAPLDPLLALRAHMPGFRGPTEVLPALDRTTGEKTSVLAIGRLTPRAWFQLPAWTRPKILFGLDSAFTEHNRLTVVEDLAAYLTEPVDTGKDWLGLMARQQYGVAGIPGFREAVPAIPPVTGPSAEEWVLMGAGVFWPEEAHGWEPRLLEGMEVKSTVGGHTIRGRYSRLGKGRMAIQLQSETPHLITTARPLMADPDSLHTFSEAQLEALFRLTMFLGLDRHHLRDDFLRLTTRIKAIARSGPPPAAAILAERQDFFDALPGRLASRGANQVPVLLNHPTPEIQAQVLYRMGFGPWAQWPGNVVWQTNREDEHCPSGAPD